MGRAGRALLAANLVDLPQAPAGGRRRLRRRPEHLATARAATGQGSGSRCAGWLAGGRRLAGMRTRAVRDGGPQVAGEMANAGRQPSHQITMAEQERLMAERHASLREAFSRLSPCCQRLLTLLIDEPPMPDTEISARLDVPVGSIGPAQPLPGQTPPRSGDRCADPGSERHHVKCLAGRHCDDHQHNAPSGSARGPGLPGWIALRGQRMLGPPRRDTAATTSPSPGSLMRRCGPRRGGTPEGEERT